MYGKFLFQKSSKIYFEVVKVYQDSVRLKIIDIANRTYILSKKEVEEKFNVVSYQN